MAKVAITKYGWPLIKDALPEEAHNFFKQYYMVDTSTTGTKYMCFTDAAKRIIWRETEEAGVTKLEFSYGSWDQKGSLTYVPINSTLEVTA